MSTKPVARDKLVELIATLPACLIGMEACTGAHHWARLFMGHGHSVRLIAPRFVTPNRLSGLGEITATALRATIGNGAEFKCDRQVAAWLGLVAGAGMALAQRGG